jgi:hypothetical protein
VARRMAENEGNPLPEHVLESIRPIEKLEEQP